MCCRSVTKSAADVLTLSMSMQHANVIDEAISITLLVPVLSSLHRHAEINAEVHQCTGTYNVSKLLLPNTRIQLVVAAPAAVTAEKNARLLLQGCFQVRHLAVELVLCC